MLLHNGELEVVEVCDRICLGPQPYSTCFKRIVTNVQYGLPVVDDLKVIVTNNYAEGMPLLHRDDLVEVREFVSNPFHHSIKANILL